MKAFLFFKIFKIQNTLLIQRSKITKSRNNYKILPVDGGCSVRRYFRQDKMLDFVTFQAER